MTHGSPRAQIPGGSGILSFVSLGVDSKLCTSDTIATFLRCALLFWSKTMWHLKCEPAILHLEVNSCQFSRAWVRKKIQLYGEVDQ